MMKKLLKRKIVLVPLVTILLLVAVVGVAFACNWNHGITPYEECDGYGITVDPQTVYDGRFVRYVPISTQISGVPGGWNPVPQTDGPHAWNPSGQHNYEVKIRYQKQSWFLRWWNDGVITMTPFHENLYEPDNCYVTCSETVENEKVYDNWYNVGSPVWDSWVDNGDDTYTRTGTQAIARDWTQDVVDARDNEHICYVNESSESGEKAVEETEDNTVRVQTGRDCDRAWAYYKHYDPDGVFVRNSGSVEHFWVDLFGPEDVILLGEYIEKEEVCIYNLCLETITNEKVYGEWYDVGLPVWDPWVDNGDDTYTRTGTQAIARDWIQNTVDETYQDHICSVDTGTEPGEKAVEETRDGSVNVFTDADCVRAWAYEEYFDPDGIKIGQSETVYYNWIKILELEKTILLGEKIFEPDKCLGSDGFVDESDCDQAKVCYIVYDPEGEEVLRVCESEPWVKEHEYEVIILVLFEGTEMERTFIIEEGEECESCVPRWTGRWVYVYIEDVNYPCRLVSFEVNPLRFKNPEYVGKLCSSNPCLPEWEGTMKHIRIKEMKMCDGSFQAGNHYDTSCGTLTCEE